MSGAYGPADDAESIRTIHRAIDLGITLLDTAGSYGGGHNESLIGRAIRGRRDAVVIATKFGTVSGPDGLLTGLDGSPANAVSSCDRSLQRLGVETIDVYYLHRIDPNVPLEETIGAMATLVTQGKVREIGMCEASAASLRRADRIHPIAALQTEYSLWYREPERAVMPTCRDLGVTYVAYSPLGRALLTGTIRAASSLPTNDARREHPRFDGMNLERNLEIVDRLRRLAEEKGCTVSQLALAWILNRSDGIVPIPGSKRLSHLEENAAARDVELSAREVAEIEAIAPIGAGVGDRYPERILKTVDQ
jgi:aryl-alcohol dehydrogenase-like predicted oxidoreductase